MLTRIVGASTGPDIIRALARYVSAAATGECPGRGLVVLPFPPALFGTELQRATDQEARRKKCITFLPSSPQIVYFLL